MNYWKEIWTKKGLASTTNLTWLDGFEDSPLNPKEIANWIIKELNIKSSDKVLEVGCGAGMLAQYIAPKCNYIGIDFSKSLLEKHIKLIHNFVIYSEANDIPFKDKYFDKSFSYSVFHYFPNKEYSKKALNEMKRTTKSKILVGDVPFKSDVKEHLVFTKKDFSFYSVITQEQANLNRMNVIIEV